MRFFNPNKTWKLHAVGAFNFLLSLLMIKVHCKWPVTGWESVEKAEKILWKSQKSVWHAKTFVLAVSKFSKWIFQLWNIFRWGFPGFVEHIWVEIETYKFAHIGEGFGWMLLNFWTLQWIGITVSLLCVLRAPLGRVKKWRYYTSSDKIWKNEIYKFIYDSFYGCWILKPGKSTSLHLPWYGKSSELFQHYDDRKSENEKIFLDPAEVRTFQPFCCFAFINFFVASRSAS